MILPGTRCSESDTSAEAAQCRSLRSKLVSNLLQSLFQLPADDQQTPKDLILLLLSEMSYLQTGDRIKLVNACLAAFEEEKQHALTTLQLVPAALLLIQHGASTDSQPSQGAGLDSGETAAAGAPVAPSTAHRDSALHRLVHCSWKPAQVCGMLGIMKDIPMTPEQLRLVMHKAFKACK